MCFVKNDAHNEIYTDMLREGKRPERDAYIFWYMI